MKHYLIYKITNKLNGKIYIGSHKTEKLDDGYMGSGKYLNLAIEKHGLENFTKEILHDFDNPDDMYAKEAELVNEDYLSEDNTYNLRVGGFGGWDYINVNRLSKLKRKLTFKEIKHQQGAKNSAYGKHWYTDGKNSIRAKVCPEGWAPGRICLLGRLKT